MRERAKKTMLGVLAACSCFAISGGLAVTQGVKADGTAEIRPNFYLDKGAMVRLDTNQSGIRFQAYVEKEYYDALANKTVTVSVNKAEDPVAEQAVNFTFENLGEADLQDGYYVMKASIIYDKLTSEQTLAAYPMELKATAYLSVDGQPVYAESEDGVRSMRGVALSAIANGETNSLVYRYIGDGDSVLDEGEYVIAQGGGNYIASEKFGVATYTGIASDLVIKEAYANAEKLDFNYYFEDQGLVLTFKNADLTDKEIDYISFIDEKGNVYQANFGYSNNELTPQKLETVLEADSREGDTLTFSLPEVATMGLKNMANCLYKVEDSNGTEIPVLSVSGNTFTVAKTAVTKGESSLKLTMLYGQIFEVPVYTADLIIKTEKDFETFTLGLHSTYNSASTLVALGADITAATKGTRYNSTTTNSNFITFDGRGHYIKDFKFCNGLLGYTFNGTIKNVAILDCESSPYIAMSRGLVCTYMCGNAENVYISGCSGTDATTGIFAWRIRYGTNNYLKNVVIDLTNATAAAENYLSAEQACGSATFTNVYGIGSYSKLYYADGTSVGGTDYITTVNTKIFNSVEQFRADTNAVNALVQSSKIWTVFEGSVYFGDLLVAPAVLDVEYDIDLSDSVENYQIDLSKIGDYKAADVTAVTLANDVAVTFKKGEGSILNIAKTSVSSLAKGVNTLAITINEKILSVKLYVADLIIYGNADLVEYNSKFSTYSASGKLIALGASFDASGCTALGADSKTNTAYAKHTLDGRGYVISNLSIKISIMGNPQTGSCTVKNLGLINPAMTADAGTAAGVFFDSYFDANDVIENCYVKGLTSTGTNKGYHNLVGGHNGNKGGTFRNVVVDYSTVSFGTDNYTTGSVYSNGGTLENVYGVGAYTKFYHGHGSNAAPTQTNCKAYTSVDLLLADTGAGNAAATLAGNGAWNIKEGKLYFGATVIGTLPVNA